MPKRPSKAVELDQLGQHLTRWVERQIAEDEEILRSTVAAEVANRTLAYVAELSTTVARDTGEYARGWEADAMSDRTGWRVLNTVPYAGVIELGRRPNRPGPPFEPIFRWVQRRYPTLSEAEQRSLAWAVREDIHIHGTPAKRILGNAVDKHWDRWLAEAVELHIERRRRK